MFRCTGLPWASKTTLPIRCAQSGAAVGGAAGAGLTAASAAPQSPEASLCMLHPIPPDSQASLTLHMLCHQPAVACGPAREARAAAAPHSLLPLIALWRCSSRAGNMEGPNWAAEQQWWQQQWGGQPQQHQQQPGWGAHAVGASGGPYAVQHAGQSYAGYAAPANNLPRQPVLGDQRALFMQAAQPGQRPAGGGRGGSVPGGGKAGRKKGPAGVSGVPLAAAGDYLEPYPAVKSLMQRFR